VPHCEVGKVVALLFHLSIAELNVGKPIVKKPRFKNTLGFMAFSGFSIIV